MKPGNMRAERQAALRVLRSQKHRPLVQVSVFPVPVPAPCATAVPADVTLQDRRLKHVYGSAGQSVVRPIRRLAQQRVARIARRHSPSHPEGIAGYQPCCDGIVMTPGGRNQCSPTLPIHRLQSAPLLNRKVGDVTTTGAGEHPLCGDRENGSSGEHSLCVRQGRVTPARDVDHVQRVLGANDPLFWDPANHQSLCASCHSTKTATENQ